MFGFVKSVVIFGFVALSAVGLSTTARANGNYSHLWMAMSARDYLPAGEQRDMVFRADMVDVLRNGAMYPDGGYAVGDGYGEISHWEPFHTAYLNWIKENFSPPWSDEAITHIVFLMGMTAHGISDQLYDGMFLERHEYFDENDGGSLQYGVDGATDSCFAATQGPMTEPAAWAPYETLAPLYQGLGHTVEPSTIELGQNFVVFAVTHANIEAGKPELIAEYMEMLPYACGHQDDPNEPGSPISHGPSIAKYWQVLWSRLNGDDGFAQDLVGSYFSKNSSWEYPQDYQSPDSWVSFMMPRGLDTSTVNSDTVYVTDEGGNVIPTYAQVYYGRDSHLINIKPLQNWTDDMTFTVNVELGIASWDGVQLGAPHSFVFSTKSAPYVEQPPEMAEDSGMTPEVSEDVAITDAGVNDATDPGDGDVTGLPADVDVYVGLDTAEGHDATVADDVDVSATADSAVATTDLVGVVDNGGASEGPTSSDAGSCSSDPHGPASGTAVYAFILLGLAFMAMRGRNLLRR